MTVIVDVENQNALKILQNLESLGLIHVKPPVQEDAAATAGNMPKTPQKANPWMRGWSKASGDTMEAYFERKRRDKEEELAQEQRQFEERYAKVSS